MSEISPSLMGALGHEAGDKRIDILRRIDEAGSISAAAREAGVSYKAAWQALETLANLAGTPLVEKVVGGSGGGGAVLTPAGRRVLQAADAMAAARHRVLRDLSNDGQATNRAALALQTSMRNQFPCTVGKVKYGQGRVRVELLLPDGQAIYSHITRISAQLLGLAAGVEVLALCKATAIRVIEDGSDLAGHNAIAGKVSRAPRRAGGELALRIAGGIQLVGFADAGYRPKAGQKVDALYDASSIVIAAVGQITT